MADDQAPAEGQEPAVVETPDGVEHVGELPASAELRTGWFRSPGGHIAHADGPSQVRAFGDRGWSPISEDEAKQVIAGGIRLEVDRADSNGTFDAESVQRAVRDETTTRPRRRRA